MNKTETVFIPTASGHTLAATYFYPAAEVRATILIVPGMAVSQRLYAALASWLAAQGFLVATFDFSGIGQSRRGALREHEVKITDWAQFECAAMIDALCNAAPDAPLYWLGHSLGAQILGFVPNRERVAKLIIIASGTGYWIHSPPGLRWRVWWLWYVLAPLSMRAMGYFPGKALRMIGDLPRGVMEQWRHWCMHPDYAVGVEGETARAQFAALQMPLSSISFTDDEFMSARNTQALLSFYCGAPQQVQRIAPGAIGAHRIGHFGFFNAQFERSLWQAYLLLELTAPS